MTLLQFVNDFLVTAKTRQKCLEEIQDRFGGPGEFEPSLRRPNSVNILRKGQRWFSKVRKGKKKLNFYTSFEVPRSNKRSGIVKGTQTHGHPPMAYLSKKLDPVVRG